LIVIFPFSPPPLPFSNIVSPTANPPPPGHPGIFFSLSLLSFSKTTKTPNTENTSGSNVATVNLTTVQITPLPLHMVSAQEDTPCSAAYPVFPSLNFWRQNYFFLILAHPVYKM